MNKIIQIILDFIFPIECLHCCKEGEFLCDHCLKKIKLRDKKQCPLCNKKQSNDNLCSKCRSQSCLDKIIICADYENIILQKTILYFKYKYVRNLHIKLAHLMINTVQNIDLPSNTIIIPTPLHKRRKLERGFNQSELLANHIATYFNITLITNALVRKKNIQHQADLNRKQRRNNIKNCFVLKNKELIKNKNILLIDDVITTGATLNEQAKLLKQNNAQTVWALVIAKN